MKTSAEEPDFLEMKLLVVISASDVDDVVVGGAETQHEDINQQHVTP